MTKRERLDLLAYADWWRHDPFTDFADAGARVWQGCCFIELALEDYSDNWTPADHAESLALYGTDGRI